MKMDRQSTLSSSFAGSPSNEKALAVKGIAPGATFFFSANTQYENAGDALINRELLKVLRRWGRIRIARSGAPVEFLRQLRLERGELRHNSRWTLWANALIFGLRARLSRTQKPVLVLTPGDPGGRLDHDVVLRGAFMLALYIAGVRIVRLGVSLGRMSPGRLRFEAFLSRFYTHIGTRDSHSLSLAKASGFRNFDYFPDLALALVPVERPQRQDGVLNVVVSLRDDNLGWADRSLLVAKLDQVIETLSCDGIISLHFVAQVGIDGVFARYLRDRFADRVNAVMTEEQDLDRLAGIYLCADLIVSNRLHALLLASAQGATPLGLLFPEINIKVIELLGDLGLGNHWRSPGDTDLPNIAELAGHQDAVRTAFRASGRTIEDRAKALFGN